jgi:hypothetical protein
MTEIRSNMPTWEEDCITWRGHVLTGKWAHWCYDWDGLPIDETCGEFPCCCYAYRALPRKLKKWAALGYPKRRNERHLRRRIFRAHPAKFRQHLASQKLI